MIYYAKNIKGDNPSCAPTLQPITVNLTAAASPDVRFLSTVAWIQTPRSTQGVSNSGNGIAGGYRSLHHDFGC